eukprot:COSAG06_NODE_473_length_15308_cov_162.912952_4_plen_206_part_00
MARGAGAGAPQARRWHRNWPCGPAALRAGGHSEAAAGQNGCAMKQRRTKQGMNQTINGGVCITTQAWQLRRRLARPRSQSLALHTRARAHAHVDVARRASVAAAIEPRDRHLLPLVVRSSVHEMYTSLFADHRVDIVCSLPHACAAEGNGCPASEHTREHNETARLDNATTKGEGGRKHSNSDSGSGAKWKRNGTRTHQALREDR